jgi:hypothetical protein
MTTDMKTRARDIAQTWVCGNEEDALAHDIEAALIAAKLEGLREARSLTVDMQGNGVYGAKKGATRIVAADHLLAAIDARLAALSPPRTETGETK